MNWGFYILIALVVILPVGQIWWGWVSYVLTGALTILTATQIWWKYLLEYFLKDARTNDHKDLRRRLLLITLVLFFANQFVIILNNYQTKKEKDGLAGKISTLSSNQTALINNFAGERKDLKAQITNLDAKVSDLIHDFSTNSSIMSEVRIEMLSKERDKFSEESNRLKQQHEVLSTSVESMEALRAERDNELAQKENEKRRAELQREIDAIKNKQAQQQQEQQIDQKIFQREKELSKMVLPVFDYTIDKLYRMLAGIARDSDQKVSSDLPGITPTIYASDLMRDGRIIRGSNSLILGTNSAWKFEITTTVSPSESHRQGMFEFGWSTFASMKITSQATNGESTLTIAPYIGNAGEDAIPPPRLKNATRLWFDHVSINLSVPNGLSTNQYAEENYTNAIDKGLRGLIEAQDQQYPLTLKSK